MPARPNVRSCLLASISIALMGCSRPAPPAPASAEPAPPVVAPPAGRAAPAAAFASGIEWIDAPPAGDVADQVRLAYAQAQHHGRVLLVYVGARWCEPCVAFHDAAASGRLDGRLAGLRLLAYDLDRDRDRLAAAGYTSEMIPLFAGTAPDGMATQRKLGGAIKGPEAVDVMTTRVVRMMNGQRRFDARVRDGAIAPPAAVTPAAVGGEAMDARRREVADGG